ncbi:phosphoethanolamine transferase [Fusobacterium sp.]|uniref:phosphoethanolamine transferase n=1 Tax=Fusobacterium sp. TaxID=68766 RepID=UPI002625AE3C|nr:phosphoethanolamine transferase [Fusobacterium sp.]
MKVIKFLLKKEKEVFQKDFFIILVVSFFNQFPYGMDRYFYGKYMSYSLIVKIFKEISSFLGFFLLVFGIVMILEILNNKIKTIILKLMLNISFILFLIEVFLLILFREIITVSVIQIFLETNKNEVIEFLSVYFNIKIILGLIFILFLYFRVKKLKFSINKSIATNNIFNYIFIIIISIKFFSITTSIDIFSIVRLYNSIKIACANIKEYNMISQKLDNNNINIISNKAKIKNIVLIIGESTTKNHMSLYNYKIDTNPLLKKLESDKNLYKFTDTISPHAQTIPSLKKVLTFYNYDSTNEWYNYNNIISIMKKAGYKTFWFSNQEASGVYGNVTAALGSKSDRILFNRLSDSSSKEIDAFYDEEIVDKSLKHIDKKLNKNFIIYHLMGTHARYSKRYPKKFEVFQDNNKIISQYDNAVLYNDYVVNKIISKFKDEEVIILYISDHGEEVYDFRNFSGHAENKPSRYMVEIPFLIYVSDKFKENYPEIILKIKNSLDRPYMTDDLIHTILDISKIKTIEYDETRSIINDNFNLSRKRIFSGKDYDSYWKNKNN